MSFSDKGRLRAFGSKAHASDDAESYPSKASLWRSFFSILVFGIAGSAFLIWQSAVTSQAYDGGHPLQVTRFGHYVFLGTGVVLGTCSTLYVAMLYLTFADSPRRNRRSPILALVAIVAAIGLAYVAYLGLSLMVLPFIPSGVVWT